MCINCIYLFLVFCYHLMVK